MLNQYLNQLYTFAINNLKNETTYTTLIIIFIFVNIIYKIVIFVRKNWYFFY